MPFGMPPLVIRAIACGRNCYADVLRSIRLSRPNGVFHTDASEYLSLSMTSSPESCQARTRDCPALVMRNIGFSRGLQEPRHRGTCDRRWHILEPGADTDPFFPKTYSASVTSSFSWSWCDARRISVDEFGPLNLLPRHGMHYAQRPRRSTPCRLHPQGPPRGGGLIARVMLARWGCPADKIHACPSAMTAQMTCDCLDLSDSMYTMVGEERRTIAVALLGAKIYATSC